MRAGGTGRPIGGIAQPRVGISIRCGRHSIRLANWPSREGQGCGGSRSKANPLLAGPGTGGLECTVELFTGKYLGGNAAVYNATFSGREPAVFRVRPGA